MPPTTIEDRVQVGLMLATGLAAAAFSWSHVIDLATGHGQAGWRAWVVALVLETAAVSGGLEVRRRRRGGQEARWALAALVAAVILQVAAQVAMAEATPWGVVLAVVPAVVFLLLVKIALARMPEPVATRKRPGRSVTADQVARPAATASAPQRPEAVASHVASAAGRVANPMATAVAGGGHPQLAIVASTAGGLATPADGLVADPVAAYLADPAAMTYAELAARLGPGVTAAAARSRVRTRQRQMAAEEARSA